MLAALLGGGLVNDAFVVAFRLPNHFRAIFGEGAFNAAFVPSYSRVLETEGADEAKAFLRPDVRARCWPRRSCCWRSPGRFTPLLLDLLAPGFRDDPTKFDLAVALTRITFPYLLFITLVTLRQ